MSGAKSEETSAEKSVEPAAEIPPELAAEGFVDVTPSRDGGVLKLVKQAGYDTDCPVEDDNISVHYVATLADGGTQCDSSRERGKPLTFRLGKGLCHHIGWINSVVRSLQLCTIYRSIIIGSVWRTDCNKFVVAYA